jgi:undecaprenyl-diphosphatase
MHLRHRHRPRAGGLHGHPPLTPAAVLLRLPFVVPLLVVAFVFLAIGAAVSDGELLLTWDEPVERALQDVRTPWLNEVVKSVSSLGGTAVVVVGLVVLLLFVYRRCRSLALVLLVATLARPAVEWGLKMLIDRPRPSFDQLTGVAGASFPSGHPMAAIALWGLLPPVIALFTHRHALWWASVVASAAIVGVVGLSRVYLGVHWLSDVVGAWLLGALYLLAVEWLLDWHHERVPCQAFVKAGHDLDEDFADPRSKDVEETPQRV